MQTNRIWLGICICLCLSPLGATAADDISVSAEVDQGRIREAHQLQLTVTVSGAGSGEVRPPDTSRISDFEIVSAPSVSSSFRWINGQTASSRSYSYRLRPRKTGLLRIPPLGILHEGKTYRTRPIEVTVLPGGSSGQPDRRRVGPGGRPPDPGTRRSAPSTDETTDPDTLRLRAVVDKQTAYVGEQITVRFLLATQTEVLSLNQADNPTFPGFWTEDIDLPENLDMRRVTLDGQTFNEFTLMKKVLFPTTSGQLKIPGVGYRIQVRRRSRDAFESFFFTPTETLARRSAPLTIDVRPLPEAGKPADFSGAVGRFNLSVKADRQEAQVNDAIGLQIRIAGEGSLNAVSAPRLADLTDFKKFDPKVTSAASVRGDRFRAEKTWDYVVIPLAAGGQEIPQVRFSYFDPEADAYRQVSSASIPVQVARAEGAAGSFFPPVAQSDVRRLQRDIHYIKLAPGGLSDLSGLFYRSPLFATLVLLPLLANAGIVVTARLRSPSQARTRQRRERRARAAARRRLKEARRQMIPASSRAFYAIVAQALTDYVGDKFDTSGAGLTHQRIEELLSEHEAPAPVRTAYHRCLEACDFARFAPAASSQAEMRKTLERAEQALVGLERSLGT